MGSIARVLSFLEEWNWEKRVERGRTTWKVVKNNKEKVRKIPCSWHLVVPPQHPGPNEVPFPAAFEYAKKIPESHVTKVSEDWRWVCDENGSMGHSQGAHLPIEDIFMMRRPIQFPPNFHRLSWWQALSKSSDANGWAVCHLCFSLQSKLILLSGSCYLCTFYLCQFNGRWTNSIKLHMV